MDYDIEIKEYSSEEFEGELYHNFTFWNPEIDKNDPEVIEETKVISYSSTIIEIEKGVNDNEEGSLDHAIYLAMHNHVASLSANTETETETETKKRGRRTKKDETD